MPLKGLMAHIKKVVGSGLGSMRKWIGLGLGLGVTAVNERHLVSAHARKRRVEIT